MIDLDLDQKMARCRRRKTAIPPPSLVRDELHWSNELPAETGRKPPLRPFGGRGRGPTPEGLIASPCPSPPGCGGGGRAPAGRRREGEVGSAAVRDWGAPPTSPRPSPPPRAERR